MKTYKNFSVTSSCYDGKGNKIPYHQAWYEIWLESRRAILSRPDGSKFKNMSEAINSDKIKVGEEIVDKKEYMSRISNMGLQYMNFPVFILKIQGSCLFRDFLFNINKIGMWAESNRFLFSILDENAVYDESNYPISSEYKDIPEWEEQFDKYMKAIKIDKVVDHNRIEMPYSISSLFWVAINAKTLMDVISFMKLHTPFFYNTYGVELEKVLKSSIDVKIPSKPSSAMYQYLNESWSGEGCHKIDDTYVINSKMGLILYSQFIRQSDTCITGLYNELIHNDPEDFKHKVFKGGTILNIHYVANKYKVKSTISTRLCAFAMSSGDDPCSWSYFLNNFLPDDVTNEFLMGILPCSFKYGKLTNCKFHDDIKFRNEGKELSNCPCPLVSLNMDDAKAKKERDNNKIGDAFYNLTKHLKYHGLIHEYRGEFWTSELIIRTETPLYSGFNRLVEYIMDYLDKYVSTKFGNGEDPDEVLNKKYMKFAMDGDNTCMMKGLAIDILSDALDNNKYSKYLISFGGDIFGKETEVTTRVDDSDFYIHARGTFSIFTSGNTSKRGDHITGGGKGTNTVLINWLLGVDHNNTLADILATKMMAGEDDQVEEVRNMICSSSIDSIRIIDSKVQNNTYCASPFFNDKQVEIRDKMISKFSNPFRPDLTESSKKFDDGDNDAVTDVVNDNMKGIRDNDLLVFPKRTNDLGTLFEVGYALVSGKPVISYDEVSGTYVLNTESDVFFGFERYVPCFNDPIIFDCSNKKSVISMGVAAGTNSRDNSSIYYELKGNPDNIMLSTLFNHVELNKSTGEYEKVSRDPNERDRNQI